MWDMGKPAPKPDDTSHLRTLSNGAVYDMRIKRIVANPGGGTKAFTSETASAALELRRDQKREAVRRAANTVAAQGGGVDGRELVGDWAFVEAIGEAMTMKALTVNDPKAVDAANWVMREVGIAENQQENTQAAAAGAVAGASAALLLIAELKRRGITSQIIDVEANGSDN